MINLRQTTVLPTLMLWRAEVIRNVFGCEPTARLLVANRQYYTRHIADGSHFALIAADGGEDCGCGGVCFTDELPSPDNPSGRCAYLMNIYVRDAYRNKGIAHLIVRRLVEEAQKRNCGKIYLETTAEGKPVYKSIGFEDLPDMMKYHAREDE